LCRDTVTGAGALVVVELKRGRPPDKVIGQAARYMGYLRAHMAQSGLQVEGLIVARGMDGASGIQPRRSLDSNS
jgi:RecB family endonuclease NucS